MTCPTTIPPLCPQCPEGEACSLTIQTCDSCAQRKCIKSNATIDQNSGTKTHGNSVGPIVGGVIAGFFVLGLVGFLIWRNLKKKKEQKEAAAEKANGFGASRAARVREIVCLGFLLTVMAYFSTGFYTYRRFHIVYNYPCFKCHTNRISAWCDESFSSFDSRPRSIYTTCSTTSRGMHPHNSVSQFSRRRHILLRRGYPPSILLHNSWGS